jgi:hypothetical protein
MARCTANIEPSPASHVERKLTDLLRVQRRARRKGRPKGKSEPTAAGNMPRNFEPFQGSRAGNLVRIG